MAIPKIIHYCWFGKNEMPLKEKECVAGWKKFYPDYEFKIWNEDNFDYNKCIYARQAYERGYYAFVSDYVRAKVLYEYGGIYLDTDVKIIKKLPNVPEKGFLGFERRKFIGTAVMAAEPESELIAELLDYYEQHGFVQQKGYIDSIANVSILTDICRRKGLIPDGRKQKIEGFEIFSRELFYPKKLNENTFETTGETCAIHMCSNSWMTEREKKRGNNKIWINVLRPVLIKIRCCLRKLLGDEMVRKIEIIVRNKMK